VQLDGHDDLACCSTRFGLCEGHRRRLEPVEDIIFDDGFELAVISQLSKLLRTNKLSTVCTHARTHEGHHSMVGACIMHHAYCHNDSRNGTRTQSRDSWYTLQRLHAVQRGAFHCQTGRMRRVPLASTRRINGIYRAEVRAA